jgi:glycosyltransferase involved in cell wall biosynthesis
MHVLRLSVGLRDLGWDVEVAGPPDSVVWPDLEAAGVPLHPLSIRSEPGVADLPGTVDVRVARALRALDRRSPYDIVHAHSSRAGGLVRAALPDRRRLIYTPNCFAFTTGFSRMRRAVYRGLEQVLVPRTGALVATCEWERGQAARLIGAAARTIVIPNGVPLFDAAGDETPLAAFADGRPLAGMVAALRDQKDPLALVRAAAAMADGGEPPGRVAIVGNGPLAADVEAEIKRLGVGDSVRRFPFEGPPEAYLRALDLFVLPSLWEAFPIANLEAMACGVPVLATRVGGVGEQVVDGVTGRVIAPHDPRALAEALAEALGDVARLRAWGEAARERVRSRYTIGSVAEQTATLYRAAMGAR